MATPEPIGAICEPVLMQGPGQCGLHGHHQNRRNPHRHPGPKAKRAEGQRRAPGHQPNQGPGPGPGRTGQSKGHRDPAQKAKRGDHVARQKR